MPSSLQGSSLLLLFIPLEVRAQLLPRGCWRLVNTRAGKTSPAWALGSPRCWTHSQGLCPQLVFERVLLKIKTQVEMRHPPDPREHSGTRNGKGRGDAFSVPESRSPRNPKGRSFAFGRVQCPGC